MFFEECGDCNLAPCNVDNPAQWNGECLDFKEKEWQYPYPPTSLPDY